MIRTGLIFTAIFFAAATALSALGWMHAPAGEPLPVHFGPDGQPDRYGGKWEAFAIIPPIILGIGLICAVLPSIDPRGKNLQRSATPYLISWIGGMAVATLAQAAITFSILYGLDPSGGPVMIRGILLATALLFLLLGNVLPKARPNFFLGVRTPWTLTSDLSWQKTHRLIGRLWVAVGLIGVPLALFAPVQTALWLIVGGSVGAAIIAVVYSFLVWRGAPDRNPGPQPE